MKIAFLATGIMGAPMCRNLLRAGHSVAAWNRTSEKAKALEKDGATFAASASDAVRGRECVFIMASDGPACDEILFGAKGAAESMESDSLAIVCASIPPETAREQAQKLSALGRRIGYADAPVSGGEKGAREGTLSVMVGGAEADAKRAMSVLESVGNPIHMGGVGCGQLAKLANQAVVGATILAVAEALLLAERGGADAKSARAALLGGFANSEILRQHGARMLSGDFAPGGPAKYQLKDLKTVLREAESAGLRMPGAEAAAEMFSRMIDAGMGELDHSALYKFMKEAA